MKLKSKLFVIALVVISLTGCKIEKLGYSFAGTSIPPEVKTFSVAFFENNAPINSPLLSQTFTEKLKQKFIEETSLDIETSNGDFSFSGSIVGYTIAPVSAQSTDNAQLNRLTITVNVKLDCPKKPSLNFEQPFSNFEDFDATLNFSTVEDELIDEITIMLVQQIFNKAAINW
jgi:hypothetical protein